MENGSRKLRFRTSETAAVAVLEVEDTGPGLTPHQINNLFKAFFTTKSSGTGVGLQICRSIVETYGGKILASNIEGGSGAIFRVELPAASQTRCI